jgi:ribosomal protein L14E/L6E/L27E
MCPLRVETLRRLAVSQPLRYPDLKYIGEELCADITSLQVRKTVHESKPRATLQPGTVLILLAGRFRGKRVILLKHLSQGVLLVTGPFKVNGVPLRRVNARYVIATSMKVDLKGIDSATVEKVGKDGYFTAEKKKEKAGEEAFFKQGEKPEVCENYNHLPEKTARLWRKEKDANSFLEEEDCEPTRQRPKGRRQGSAVEYQERATPARVPTKHIQPPQG